MFIIFTKNWEEVKEIVPVDAVKAYRSSWDRPMAPPILSLSTIRWVGSFTPRPLDPRETTQSPFERFRPSSW